jgi:hypothetical protein
MVGLEGFEPPTHGLGNRKAGGPRFSRPLLHVSGLLVPHVRHVLLGNLPGFRLYVKLAVVLR